MYSIKGSSGSWAVKTFALSKSNDSLGGKKARVRRSKEERKTMVELFIKKYQKLNNGNFPSLNLTHKEVGGSFYTVREIVREIIQENRVLGPAMRSSRGMSSDQFMAQYPLGSISVEPQIPMSLSSDEDNVVSRHHEVTSEGVVIISEDDYELQNTGDVHFRDSIQVVVKSGESDGLISTERKLTDTSEADGNEKRSFDNGNITSGFQKDVKCSNSDESASSELQESEIPQIELNEQKAVDIGNTIGGIQADIKSGASNGLAGKELGVTETAEANIQEDRSFDYVKIINGTQVDIDSSVSNELVSTDSQKITTKADSVDEKQNIDNGSIADGVQVGIDNSVSNEPVSTESHKKTTMADDVDEKQNIDNGNITDVVQVDSKSSVSDEPVNTELRVSGISEADLQDHQSATNGNITNGHQLGVKTQGSDGLASKELRGSEFPKRYIASKEVIKSSAKVTQIIEDVVVETFPIRPTPKPTDGRDTDTVKGRNLPKEPEEKEALKVELGPRTSSHDVNGMPSQNGSGKEMQPTAAAKASSPPVNNHAKVLNGTLANSNGRKTITQEANLVKAKADNGQRNNERNATLDRMDLHSWAGGAKTSGNQGPNPFLSIFRAFVHAFVRFWSE